MELISPDHGQLAQLSSHKDLRKVLTPRPSSVLSFRMGARVTAASYHKSQGRVWCKAPISLQPSFWQGHSHLTLSQRCWASPFRKWAGEMLCGSLFLTRDAKVQGQTEMDPGRKKSQLRKSPQSRSPSHLNSGLGAVCLLSGLHPNLPAFLSSQRGRRNDLCTLARLRQPRQCGFPSQAER